MTAVVAWFEAVVSNIPLPVLEVWGRFAFVVGLFLAICAFGGFTFRIGSIGIWPCAPEVGHEGVPEHAADVRADHRDRLHRIVHRACPGRTDVLSWLKDLAVLLSIVLLGYPALITIPFAYGLSDLIEGVPPEFLLAWLPDISSIPRVSGLPTSSWAKIPTFGWPGRGGDTWRPPPCS